MRTRSRRLLRNRKGGAEVAIAIILAMVVAVSYVHNILIWGQFLNDEDRDRLNEKIEIEVVRFESGKLVVYVRNVGSVTAHIVAIYLWPKDSKKEAYRYNIGNITEDKERFFLEPGESKDVWPYVGSIGFTSTDKFVVSVVTERGNLATRTYVYGPGGGASPEVGELGVFRTNWFYSNYSSIQTGGLQRFAVVIEKTDDYVAFYINITNVWDRPCGIRPDSFLALNSLKPSTVQPNFYIVKNVTYNLKNPKKSTITLFPLPTEEEYNKTYIVEPEETVTLVFAAKDKRGGDDELKWTWGFGYPFGEEPGTEASGILISLFFDVYMEVSEDEFVPDPSFPSRYGQTINTQSTVLRGK